MVKQADSSNSQNSCCVIDPCFFLIFSISILSSLFFFFRLLFHLLILLKWLNHRNFILFWLSYLNHILRLPASRILANKLIFPEQTFRRVRYISLDFHNRPRRLQKLAFSACRTQTIQNGSLWFLGPSS